MTISNHIRVLRFHSGEMTQQELAQQIGVTRQTVNAIEAGKYSPSLEVAFRIAHVFNKPLEEVFQFQTPNRAGNDGGNGESRKARTEGG
jgi:putative transcriptional regulator